MRHFVEPVFWYRPTRPRTSPSTARLQGIGLCALQNNRRCGCGCVRVRACGGGGEGVETTRAFQNYGGRRECQCVESNADVLLGMFG